MVKLKSVSDPKLLELLRSGAVGVMPTDTVYGLVCSARDAAAVSRLYALKQREHKPGTVISATIDHLVQLGLKPRYLKAVEQYWPNPLSVLIPCGNELDYLDLGKRSLATRLPKDEDINKLLQKSGPLLTTSANQPGQPPAISTAEAIAYFGDRVDFYVEAERLDVRQPSTIIRIIDDAIEVVRPGAVKIDENGRISA